MMPRIAAWRGGRRNSGNMRPGTFDTGLCSCYVLISQEPRPMVTSYIVVPFSTAARGKLAPGVPQNLKDRTRAIRVAELLAREVEGVVVLEQEADVAADFYAEPKLIHHRGQVPAELLEQLAA